MNIGLIVITEEKVQEENQDKELEEQFLTILVDMEKDFKNNGGKILAWRV